MTTDLEGRLSARLHREAAEVVPDGIPIPPLPVSASRHSRWRPSLDRGVTRWRRPVLVAAAVLLVALAATLLVRAQRSDPTAAAGPGQLSPVKDVPAAPFPCGEASALTDHAAAVAGVRIGVTADWFCVMEGNNQGFGGSFMPDKVFRSVTGDGWIVAGAVAPLVDRLVWTPSADQNQPPITLDLYELGPSRGFVTISGSGGTLTAYSRGVIVEQQTVTNPASGGWPPASSSQAAAVSSPTTLSTAVAGSTAATTT